jgi:hypothetical protein
MSRVSCRPGAAIGCGRPALQWRAQPKPGMAGAAVGELDGVGLNWTPWDMIQNLRRADQHTPGLRTPHGQNAVFARRGMENPQVSGHSDGLGWAPCKIAGMRLRWFEPNTCHA